MKILGLLSITAWSILSYSLDVPSNCPYRDSQNGQTISYHYLLSDIDNLDPIKSYEWEKATIIYQAYEPLYTFSHNTKPLKLVPLMATSLPQIKFYDKTWHELLKSDSVEPSYTTYTIQIRPHIYYQPHDGFCQVLQLKDCQNFKRELLAEDYAYQIKRIAQQDAQSPFSSILAKYIYGFEAYSQSKQAQTPQWHDLRADDITGVKVLGPYTLQIITKGYYHQWLNWMTLNFFTPMPWEIDQYYHEAKLNNPWRQFSIGTGPYMLNGQKQFQEIVLVKNPNYRKEYYRFSDGIKQIPIIDKFVFKMDVEHIPRWDKFLQGYYDYSGIPAESFENNIQILPGGKFVLSDILEQRHLQLRIEPTASISGLVFNFLDPIVGGYGPKKRKLRQAISLAYDYDEFRTIFRNGRGYRAQGPIPFNIMSNMEQRLGYNHVLYYKRHGVQYKKSLEVAKRLLAEAGYPNGINPKTGKPLIINFDQVSRGLPEEKAIFSWLRKQMGKLGIQLNVREYDINRYNNKKLSGQYQMAYIGWEGDYPDPENFLMLFYGPNHQVQTGGPNHANFQDSRYDKLYEQLKRLDDGPKRDTVIRQMLEIIWTQAPWVWGSHGEEFYLLHQWMHAQHLENYSAGNFKYFNIDNQLRLKSWLNWNKPEFKPMVWFILFILIIILPFIYENYRIKKSLAKRTKF